MTWENNLTRIRRFLRDPNGNIWADSLIKNQFNSAQKEIQRRTLFLEDVQPVHVPPRYAGSYLQDWEWPFLEEGQGNYQALSFHQQAEISFCFTWEPQAVWGLVDATAPDEGYHFAHPFEAFISGAPGDLVPLQLPTGFHTAKFVAYDNEPIDFTTKKEIQGDDVSWASRSGEPFSYFRNDKLEDQFFLYPFPSTVVYEDETGTGQVLYGEDDSLSSEYGTILDIGDYVSGGEYGIATDVIESDNNVLFVFSKIPSDVSSSSDESDFPGFLQKYVEYAALDNLYSANNDGKIQSLRDYWRMRKETGIKAIERFKSLRKQDRDYRLITRGAPGFRTRRDPRLPDHYPAVVR